MKTMKFPSYYGSFIYRTGLTGLSLLGSSLQALELEMIMSTSWLAAAWQRNIQHAQSDLFPVPQE
jgi:hypothetical protein